MGARARGTSSWCCLRALCMHSCARTNGSRVGHIRTEPPCGREGHAYVTRSGEWRLSAGRDARPGRKRAGGHSRNGKPPGFLPSPFLSSRSSLCRVLLLQLDPRTDGKDDAAPILSCLVQQQLQKTAAQGFERCYCYYYYVACARYALHQKQLIG